MKYFPQWMLKSRYLNKGLRILNLVYRKIVENRVPGSSFVLEKLGSNYGGWYFPVNEVQSNWIVYSAGIGLDMTFDRAVIDRFNCKVFAFDPTPQTVDFVRMANKANTQLEDFNFSPIGLWHSDATLRFYAPRTRGWIGSYSIRNLQGSEDYFEAQCKSLATIMGELGHEKIDLLKMDIEGAEYEVLENILETRIEIDWLCVEFDQPVPVWTTEKMLWRLRKSGFDLQKIDRWNFTFAHRRVFRRAKINII
jgi:FkbM family methyltransferase